MLEVGAGSFLLACLALCSSDWRLIRSAGLVFANWIANTGGAWLLGAETPWQLYLAVDFATAVAVLLPPASRWQSALAMTYAIQCLMHLAFWWSEGDAGAAYRHWYGLYYVALSQLALIALWGGNEAGGQRLHHLGRLLSRQVGAAGLVRAASGALADGLGRSNLPERIAHRDRPVRLARVQHDAAARPAAIGSAEDGGGDRNAGRAPNLVGGTDRRGGGGARAIDAHRGTGDWLFPDGIPGPTAQDEAVILEWLGSWMRISRQSDERFREHIEKIEQAASDLKETAASLRAQRQQDKDAMADAIEEISKRLSA